MLGGKESAYVDCLETEQAPSLQGLHYDIKIRLYQVIISSSLNNKLVRFEKHILFGDGAGSVFTGVAL